MNLKTKKRYVIYCQLTNANGAYCPGIYTDKKLAEKIARSCNGANATYEVRKHSEKSA